MISHSFDLGKLIVFGNSFVAILLVAFFMVKSIMIAIEFFKEVSE